MKKYILIIASFLLIGTVMAQNETEALRYSFLTHGGSSRYQAMGGALGGLGADFSVAGSNPAALGRFSRHKFSLSVDNNITTTKTTYNGTTSNEASNKFTISQLSGVFAIDLAKKKSNWQYVQFGIGYNRHTNFHSTIRSKGTNNTSIVNVFANDGQGIEPVDLLNNRPFTTNLAYESYAVDFDASTMTYTPNFNDSDMNHDRTIERFGGIGDYTAALSANYKNKLYVGLSVSASSIKFEEKIKHKEEIIDTTGGNLLSSEYRYNLNTKGVGINAKIGFVYLPFDWLRIGVALHTPTRTHLTDTWDADMTTTQKGIANPVEITDEYKPTGKYRYYMVSPLRGVLSIGAVLGGRWAIGVETEFVNYGWAKLKSTTDTDNYQAYDFDVENSEIKNQYGTGYNVRFGLEYLINNNWSVRAGYAIYTSAYKSSIDNNRTPMMFFSGGIGYKIGIFGVDLAYSAMSQKEDYYSFDPTESSNLSEIKRLDHRINLSVYLTF